MKSKLFKIASGLLLGMTLLTTTAFASHHSSKGTHHNKKYGVCIYRNCTLKYNHKHNGIYYSPHHVNDSHSYHR